MDQVYISRGQLAILRGIRYKHRVSSLEYVIMQIFGRIQCCLPNLACSLHSSRDSSLQNIDGLHVKAGSTDVVELHGSMWKTRCCNCSVIQTNRDMPICAALEGKVIASSLSLLMLVGSFSAAIHLCMISAHGMLVMKLYLP